MVGMLKETSYFFNEVELCYMLDNMKFELLANCIKEINVKAGSAAKRTVNQSVTLLNWAIELLYF